MTAPLLVIAAGGTGGHMFPAQALAETMITRGWRVALSTDPRGARYATGFPDQVRRNVVSSGTFARGLAGRFAAPFQIAAGIVAATLGMLRDRPACVIGFGGYPALPAMAAAYLLGRPRLLHEQNGVLGRVNEVFAKRVPIIACGTWPTNVPTSLRSRHVGNPVRAAVRDRAGQPFDAPCGDGTLRVLVIGGSQGARVLSQIVPAAFATLEPSQRRRLRVSHQARSEDLAMVVASYKAAEITATVEPFFTDIPQRMASAHLVISRSGASSVAEIAAIGRPSILIPFAAAKRDEQTANAKALVDAGAAVLMHERDLDPTTLAASINAILSAPERAATMAQNARATGKPDAATSLADLVEDLAAGRPV